MRALAIAATGMNAQQTNLEVIANNIANINTTGYKRARAEFTDLLYQTERAKGVSNRGQPGERSRRRQHRSRRADVGCPQPAHSGRACPDRQRSRCRARRPRLLSDQGPGRQDALHPCRCLQQETRTASSSRSTVIRSPPNITFPTGLHDTAINRSGEVYGEAPAQSDPQLLGQFRLPISSTRPACSLMATTCFAQTPPRAIRSSARQTKRVRLPLAELSRISNVDPVKEITELISAQRAYEMNSKVIQAVDSMYGTISNRHAVIDGVMGNA